MHSATRMAASLAAMLALMTPGSAAERRCGWVENPTPANWWLRDREAEWTLSTQGMYEAPGIDTMPDMRANGWVKTNGEYGYGCGCMVVEVDRASKLITRLISVKSAPLARCRADRALPAP